MLFESLTPSVTKLALHQSKRCQRIPTLSILVGQALTTQDVWSYWLAQEKRQASVCIYASRLSLFAPWLQEIIQKDSLSSLILERLAQVTHQPAKQLKSWLSNTSEYQSNLFWQGLSLNPVEIRWLRWLFAQTTGEQAFNRGQLASPDWLKTEDFSEAAYGVTVVKTLLDEAKMVLPGMLIKLPESSGKAESISAIMSLFQLVETIPTIPVGLCLTEIQADLCLPELPESRVKTLVRTGLIEVKTPGSKALRQWLCDRAITDPSQQRTILSLAERYGATADFLDTLIALTQPAGPDIDQTLYRSQAERFLFHCLEGRPQTVGQFQVNQTLDIQFGNRPMEVDFLAETTKIVIEIDGYYHFQSPDCYRRDRRKDVELQHRGFLVLRFLADDVVDWLDDILSTIDRALAQRSVSLANSPEA
ncbi:MAG: DUF559 domain-containing protein [Symploca sp. SIO2G7]|nr:DUF559 domain-containing protein [Symploca sp. SIO2G7]